MYKLMVSYNCGISYQSEVEAKNLEELKSQLQKLDDNWLRWYIEKDGEMDFEVQSKIHKEVIGFLTRLNSRR